MFFGNTARFVIIYAFVYYFVIATPRNLWHLHVRNFIGAHSLTRRSESIKDKIAKNQCPGYVQDNARVKIYGNDES